MHKSTFLLATLLSVAFSGSTSAQDYVIGSFEGTTIGAGTGWKDWAGVNTFENSTTGATEGSTSVKVTPDELGYQQGLAVKIQDHPDAVNAFDGFINNTHIAVDVTWDPADWDLMEGGMDFARVIMIYNEPGAGFLDIGIPDPNFSTRPNIDTGNPDTPGFWDSVSYPDVHTRTMFWDYSSFLPMVTSNATDAYTEFVITTQAGDFSAPVAFYFDNIRFTTPPEGLPGDYNGDGWVDAADYTVWRDNLGSPDESALNGNGDGMGGVDAGDYTRWVDNFGTHSEGNASLGVGAVPEPSTMILFAMAVCGLHLGRRRIA